MESRLIKTKPPIGILDIPVDIITSILAILTDDELKVVASLCKRFYFESGRKLIWAPRLVDQFNVTAPSTMDHRYLYMALVREQNALIRSNVMSKLLERLQEQSSSDLQEIFSLYRNPTIGNIYIVADLLQLSHKDIAELFQYTKDILFTFISKPNGYFTQAVINQMSALYGKCKHVLNSNYRLTSEEEKLLEEFFPAAVTLENDKRKQYIDDFLDIFCLLAHLGPKHLMSILLVKHPELPKITFAKRYGVSLLHLAIEGGQYDLARMLIVLGADVNKTQTYIPTDRLVETNFMSPLYMAIRSLVFDDEKIKTTEKMKFICDLLEAGADLFAPCLDIENDVDSTPYILYRRLSDTHQLDDLLAQIDTPIAKKVYLHIWGMIKRSVNERLEQTFTACRMS